MVLLTVSAGVPGVLGKRGKSAGHLLRVSVGVLRDEAEKVGCGCLV